MGIIYFNKFRVSHFGFFNSESKSFSALCINRNDMSSFSFYVHGFNALTTIPFTKVDSS